MTRFEDFSNFVKRFKWIAALIIGAAGLTPLIAAMAGIGPAWPKGIEILTSLLIVITLILVFVFTNDISSRWKRSVIAISALAFLGTLFYYLYFFDRFVYLVPDTEITTTLGCGWTKDARDYATILKLPPDNQCPGDFEEMLSNAEYSPEAIWIAESLTKNRLMILALWLALFTSLSAFIGSFASTMSGGPPSTVSDDQPEPT